MERHGESGVSFVTHLFKEPSPLSRVSSANDRSTKERSPGLAAVPTDQQQHRYVEDFLFRRPVKHSLSDLRVQDLKIECKKRQLPVSGPKPQLILRLRQFEQEILETSSNENQAPLMTKEAVAISNGYLGRSASSDSVMSSSDSTTNSYDSGLTEPMIANQPVNVRSQLQPSQLNNRSAHVTINEFLQQQKTQPVQARHEVGHHPSNEPSQSQAHTIQATAQQKIVQYVNEEGVVIGVTTMPDQHQAPVYEQSDNFQQQQPQQIQHQQHHESQQNHAHQDSISVQYQKQEGLLQTGQGPIAQATQMVHKNENTFRFSQMGSGGQFTSSHQVAAPKPLPANSALKVALAPKISMPSLQNKPLIQTAHYASHVSHHQQNRMAIHTAPLLSSAAQQVPKLKTFQHSISQDSTFQRSPLQESNQTEMLPTASRGIQIQQVQQYNRLQPGTSRQNSPKTADQPGSSPNMPGATSSVANTPADGSEQVETGDGTNENPITLDQNADPSSLLTPQSLQLHEQMLRDHQKKIEEMMSMLNANQATLKTQQQLIVDAKKAQKARDQQRKQQTSISQQRHNREVDFCQINKQHVQQFVQHRLQQNQLQAMIDEHNRLANVEIRLQEELHVETAVNDIVRLIKQDARTALLIVQLLRRYQLERNGSPDDSTQQSQDRQAAELPAQEAMQNPPPAKSRKLHSIQSSYHVAQLGYSVTAGDQSGPVENTVTNAEQDAPLATLPSAQNIQAPIRKAGEKRKRESRQSSDVDMEEIFKCVIENASRAVETGTLPINQSSPGTESMLDEAWQQIQQTERMMPTVDDVNLNSTVDYNSAVDLNPTADYSSTINLNCAVDYNSTVEYNSTIDLNSVAYSSANLNSAVDLGHSVDLDTTIVYGQQHDDSQMRNMPSHSQHHMVNSNGMGQMPSIDNEMPQGQQQVEQISQQNVRNRYSDIDNVMVVLHDEPRVPGGDWDAWLDRIDGELEDEGTEQDRSGRDTDPMVQEGNEQGVHQEDDMSWLDFMLQENANQSQENFIVRSAE